MLIFLLKKINNLRLIIKTNLRLIARTFPNSPKILVLINITISANVTIGFYILRKCYFRV